jgi:hypothetical protein
MSLTKLFLGGNNDVIYKLFPPRESLVSDIPAGEGKIVKLFLRCVKKLKKGYCGLQCSQGTRTWGGIAKEENKQKCRH